MNTYQLNNGVEIPVLGFGTFKAKDGEEAYRAVLEALKAGYRHIDTAAIYQNEESVGQAIKDSGVPREEMFVTTKLWNSQQTYEQTRQALEKSIEKLGLDYLDLYLIHWPNPKPLRENDAWKTRNAEVWRAMEDLYRWKTSIKKGKSVLSALAIFFPIIWMPCLKLQLSFLRSIKFAWRQVCIKIKS